jgi:Zn-dependent protease with chaperone function
VRKQTRLWILLAAAAVGSVAWGVWENAKPVGARVGGVTPADSSWYQALPRDPAAATQAYLQRVPAATMAAGNAATGSYHLLLLGQLGVFLFSTWLVLTGPPLPRMRATARRFSGRAAVQDAVVAIQYFVVLFLLSLPLETYAGFIWERRAGLSHQTYLGWLRDFALGWGINTVLYVIGVVILVFAMRQRPRSWATWATLTYLALASLYVFLVPQVVEPLFNRITPLPDGPLKQQVLTLAHANGVPATDVFVRDASRQSEILNAHVSGFAGSARIVLDDNTIATTPPREVAFVMAHEIGHYVLGHEVKGLVFNTLVVGLGFLLMMLSIPGLLYRYGRDWQVRTVDDPAIVVVFWLCFSVWGYLALPINNSISREMEHEADMYGLNASRQPFGLADFMLRDADAYQVNPPRWMEAVFYNHPSARNRIYTAMVWRGEEE